MQRNDPLLWLTELLSAKCYLALLRAPAFMHTFFGWQLYRTSKFSNVQCIVRKR